MGVAVAVLVLPPSVTAMKMEEISVGDLSQRKPALLHLLVQLLVLPRLRLLLLVLKLVKRVHWG